MNKKLVEVVHLVDEGSYMFTPGWGDHFEVDGMRLPPTPCVVQDLSTVVRVTEVGGNIVQYEDGEGNTSNHPWVCYA